MDRMELLSYFQRRRRAIENNKTGDKFCSGCLQAAIEENHCEGHTLLTREQALDRCAIAITKFAVHYGS